MARQTINVGTAANDGTGDALRSAGQKINANFIELYDQKAATADLASTASGKGAEMVGFIQSGTGAETRTLQEKTRERLSIHDFLSDTVRAAVIARTQATSIITQIDAAATAAVAQGRILHFPAGTYPFVEWVPPAGLEVSTDGKATVFKQLSGASKRMIVVRYDGIRLWTGGAATLDGSMDTISANRTEQNHAISVEPHTGTHVASFACGDIYGKNIGGDVFLTYTGNGGTIGHCSVGNVYGDNIYRNIVSITGGESGTVGDVIQNDAAGRGAGLLTFDLEPDPVNGSLGDWSFGTVVGHRIGIVGDASAPLGRVRIKQINLDYTRPNSTPEYDVAGINKTSQPTTWETAVRFRNAPSIQIDQARIANFPRGAIADIGIAGGDIVADEFRVFGLLEIINCCATAVPEIAVQKTRNFVIGALKSVDKPSADNPTFIGGSISYSTLRIDAAEIEGRFCNGLTGNLALGRATFSNTAGVSVFRYIEGDITFTGVTCTGAHFIFEAPTKMPLCIGSTLSVSGGGGQAIISGGAANVQYVRCTVNGSEISHGWFNASTALKDAANDSAAATAGVPLHSLYRNGSNVMVRLA